MIIKVGCPNPIRCIPEAVAKSAILPVVLVSRSHGEDRGPRFGRFLEARGVSPPIEFGGVVVAVSNRNLEALLEGVERIGGIIHLNLQMNGCERVDNCK